MHISREISLLHCLSIFILAMAFALSGVQPARAQPQAVTASVFVSPNGNDGNSCTSPSSPCQTIKGALDKASAGQDIAVAEGTYTGTGTEVVLIGKNISLLGGWDSGFNDRTGLSIIDAENARRGVTVSSGTIVLLDHFTIQNGYHADWGAGIYSEGTLTITDSLISNNWSHSFGGGIYQNNLGSLTIDNTTISGNIAGKEGWGAALGGGGLENFGGTVTITNSTFSANSILGSFNGSAIQTHNGTLSLTNSTISGNLAEEAIATDSGTLTIKSTTIAANPFGGIQNGAANVTILNSILAKNTSSGGSDCTGNLTSQGYNLIGNNTNCTFTSATGDLVGDSLTPLDPKIGRLADYGGPTLTMALSDSSPALNAGNPATPDGVDPACPASDQRRSARGADECDIGAYEGSVPLVLSVRRANLNPTSAPYAYYTVTFSSEVHNIDTVLPLSDFKLTTTGAITGARIKGITGSGSVYTVRVYTGSGNGTLRLDVRDKDTILNGSNVPLGGPGLGNGTFNGEVYTLTKIPTPVSPSGLQWDNTPKFTWTRVPKATQYTLQVYKGTTLLYTKIVGSAGCTSTHCFTTPKMVLTGGVHKWRVRALTQGTWKPYSAFKSFTIDRPKAGYWPGDYVDLYVTPDRRHITYFSIYVYVEKCNKTYKITKNVPVPIVGRRFSFSGTLSAKGTFSSSTHATGTTILDTYYVPNCPAGAYIYTPLVSWAADWLNNSQPTILLSGPVDPALKPVESPHQVVPAWLVDDPQP